MTNEEENNNKIRLLMINTLLGNGYSADVQTKLLKQKADTEEILKDKDRR